MTVQLAAHRDARLNVGQLARFAAGLAWPAILAIGCAHGDGWWTHAIADAEARALLTWNRATHVWRLTPAGRAVTRGVS